MYEHNALGYWSALALCLTKVRSSRARCPATALITQQICSLNIPVLSTFRYFRFLCWRFQNSQQVK